MKWTGKSHLKRETRDNPLLLFIKHRMSTDWLIGEPKYSY